ncbi:MAG: ATPase [Candidatus Thorarchaeota archaeon]|nr:MAG: ATPase [Candidatus Thorarchaeota archaeon]
MTKAMTGIPGLDDLIGGGFVEGSTVLLSGCTGTGKTIFGLQFLYSGAKHFGEPGIFVTLETRPKELRSEALQFGWDLKDLEEQKKIIIIDAASSKAGLPTSEKYTLRRGFDMSNLAEEVYRAVEEIKARRLVIDSLSGLGVRFSEPSEVRNDLFRIGALLGELNVTSLVIGEVNDPATLSRAGVEQFVVQGLIVLSLSEVEGVLQRNLLIWKMRQTTHSMKKHSIVITNKGIEIGVSKPERKKPRAHRTASN